MKKDRPQNAPAIICWAASMRRLIIISVALVITGCGAGTEKVTVDGHALRMRLKGTNSPTVVFESGAGGMGLDSWEKVQAKVSRFARTVAYDRAGCGKSDPGPKPRDARRIANELHTALRKAGVQPPYVLVGHSTGAFYIRLFADAYPDEVAGMLFVDPNAEQLGPWFKTNVSEAMRTKAERDSFNLSVGGRGEWEATDLTAQQIRSAHLPTNLPSAVLTSMRPEPNHLPGFLDALLESHKELASRLPNSKHIVTAKSGHNIQQEQPELVIQAIEDIVEQIRLRKP